MLHAPSTLHPLIFITQWHLMKNKYHEAPDYVFSATCYFFAPSCCHHFKHLVSYLDITAVWSYQYVILLILQRLLMCLLWANFQDLPAPPWRCGPTRAMASSFLRFLDHTQRRITVSRTPLDAWSVRRRDLYLTKHNTRNRQTSMTPVGFEPTISAGERPKTYVLDRAAIRTGKIFKL